MGATLLFFGATQYLSFHIQERLINFDVTHEKFVMKIYSLVQLEPEAESRSGKQDLRHKYFWTYDVQLFLAMLTLASLLFYQAKSGFDKHQSTICLWLLLGMAGIYAVVLRCIAKKYHKSIDPKSGGVATTT